ncbi:peptidoglycan-binding protein [Streptomyces sp. SS7]|uniref:peptidoglycan-binding domain-containing protein n=1 Tax=Streptomyces sp. SS7 TaxID=3108485 RepID=UPI0030EDB3E9
MSEPTGLVCPECGVPRAADGSPACSCARRAADAHLENRAAETAAAEDFDPLRIRPFAEPAVAEEGAGDLAGPITKAAVAPVPEPVAQDIGGTEEAEESGEPQASAERWRPRRLVQLSGVGAAAAVLVTGGAVAALFSYQSPAREDAGPDDVRVSVPAGAAGTGTVTTRPSATASPTQTSASPTASPSETPSESATAPTGSAEPSASPTATGATSTAAPAPSPSEGRPPVLRPGDSGPEVTELQLRLAQAGFYGGDADGRYGGEVENAVRRYQLARLLLAEEPGVYGQTTRAVLESETSEP